MKRFVRARALVAASLLAFVCLAIAAAGAGTAPAGTKSWQPSHSNERAGSSAVVSRVRFLGQLGRFSFFSHKLEPIAAQHDLLDLRQIMAGGDDENGGVSSGLFVGRQRER